MIYYGASLMLCAGLGLAGVLAQLRAVLLAAYHDALWVAPLTPPRSRLERRHLRRPCAECSMVVELATAHARA